MFFLKNRLKIASLRIGKHRIVKNIALLRKVNIAHPYQEVPHFLLRKIVLSKHSFDLRPLREEPPFQ